MASLPTLPDIAHLNTLPKPTFLHSVNVLFETAPPLAEALYAARPFSSYEDLISTAERIIFHELNQEDRVLVINAHPRIGAAKQNLSALSFAEQGYGKQTEQQEQGQTRQLTEDEIVNRRLEELNDAYEAKFGFRFVVFVAGRPRKAIIPVVEERMNNARNVELATGLRDMICIARDRLKKLSPSQSNL
ncbi:hypothetical protein HK102_003146 [Quaeritorhiza haematococci]|nr:hypothetical protein HK102_003146 [Quaeritorhiza haematococci]